MDLQIITLLISGMLGVFTNVMMKVSKLNERTDYEFNLKLFLKKDWPSICISVSVVIVCLIGRGEIIQLKVLGNYLILGFFTVGLSAQSVAYFIKGRTEKQLNVTEENLKEDCEDNK